MTQRMYARSWQLRVDGEPVGYLTDREKGERKDARTLRKMVKDATKAITGRIRLDRRSLKRAEYALAAIKAGKAKLVLVREEELSGPCTNCNTETLLPSFKYCPHCGTAVQ